MAKTGVEILCVGTELLLGDILNGNARWLAQRLADLGLPHFRQTVVGDNTDRLISAVREAAGRCRILITTGGLGPTPDDLTTAALAAAFDTPLEERPELWQEIQAKLSAGGRAVAASNRSQAFLPSWCRRFAQLSGVCSGDDLVPMSRLHNPHFSWSPLGDAEHVGGDSGTLVPSERWRLLCVCESKASFHRNWRV